MRTLSLTSHLSMQVSADPLENLVRQAMYDYNLPQPKAAVWLPEGPKIDQSLMVRSYLINRKLLTLLGYITSCSDLAQGQLISVLSAIHNASCPGVECCMHFQIPCKSRVCM